MKKQKKILRVDKLPDEIELVGFGINRVVFLNEVYLNAAESQLVLEHSPDGFNWGYGGSGPSQLALAVLLKYFTDEAAISLHEGFKDSFITKLEEGNFKVRIKLNLWYQLISGKAAVTPEQFNELMHVVDLELPEIKAANSIIKT